MTKQRLNIGLVGLGNQSAENILPSLLQSPDVRIVGICDERPEMAASAGQFVSDFRFFTSAAAMLDTLELDAVVVVCPPDGHRDVAHAAIERGVNVFVEKPPCSYRHELVDLVGAAAANPAVVTGVGMNFRFARPISQARAMVDKPTFGKCVHIQLNHYANKPTEPLWSLDSTLRSFLLAQTIHTIDLAMVFGRSPLESIRTVVTREANGMIVEIGLTYGSGATATILTGTMFPYFEFDMKLISSTSTMLALDNLWNITLHELGHGSGTSGTDKRWRGHWQPGPLDSGFVRSGYQTELDSFFTCVREGRPFEADLASLLPTYDVIEEVCRSGDDELSRWSGSTGHERRPAGASL